LWKFIIFLGLVDDKSPTVRDKNKLSRECEIFQFNVQLKITNKYCKTYEYIDCIFYVMLLDVLCLNNIHSSNVFFNGKNSPFVFCTRCSVINLCFWVISTFQLVLFWIDNQQFNRRSRKPVQFDPRPGAGRAATPWRATTLFRAPALGAGAPRPPVRLARRLLGRGGAPRQAALRQSAPGALRERASRAAALPAAVLLRDAALFDRRCDETLAAWDLLFFNFKEALCRMFY